MKEQRVRSVLERMDALGLSQILVTDPVSILYLTGIWIDAEERLVALYLRRDGTACLFVNAMFHVPANPGVEVVRFADTDPYLDLLARRINPEAVLGVDKNLLTRYFLPLLNRHCAAGYTDGSVCVDGARAVKDAEEQEAMCRISQINDQAMARFRELLKPGVTERAVANQMREIYQELGADDQAFPPSVCFGANAARGHYRCGDVPLQEGACILMDVGCRKDGYCADMTRTFFCGSVSPEHRRIYQLVLQANEAAEAMIRPGVPLRDLEAAARNVIEAGGYGRYFTHRLGHFIGLSVHDAGDVSSASEAVAQPGNVFSIEPGIYLDGDVGVRIEDLVLVTEDGCRILNRYPKELQII